MPEFEKAVRELLESELACHGCHAVNIPGCERTVHLEANGGASCDRCGHRWMEPLS